MGILSLTERDGSITLSLEDARRVLPVRLQGEETFWLDVEAPSDEEASVMRELFGLEPTVVAEVRRPSQVPHLELFKGYALLVLHTVEAGPEGSRIPVAGTVVAIRLSCHPRPYGGRGIRYVSLVQGPRLVWRTLTSSPLQRVPDTCPL